MPGLGQWVLQVVKAAAAETSRWENSTQLVQNGIRVENWQERLTDGWASVRGW